MAEAALNHFGGNKFTDKQINIVITVCDSAAGESCPIFPGKPIKAHWSVPDPAKFAGASDEINAEFTRVYKILMLPLEEMEKGKLQQNLNEIGKIISQGM